MRQFHMFHLNMILTQKFRLFLCIAEKYNVIIINNIIWEKKNSILDHLLVMREKQ
jgi:hypothetical protein